jgi:preprotein translocase subunit SecB
LQLGTKSQGIDEGLYEVLLTVTVTAKIKDKNMFLVEAQQAGIFRIRNIPAGEIDPVLGIGCPNILFPYLREVVSDVVTRAGFPPVILKSG